MGFAPRAIFAFNALIDHLKASGEEDIGKIEKFSPKLAGQISESFSWGVQREVAIDRKACEFFLSNFKFEKKIVGGQAGNAAEQASALGVECYLHSNCANEELLPLFSHKEKIFLASDGGFVPASNFSSNAASAHHFVFENPINSTRFIASYDPLPLHLEDDFCRAAKGEVAQIRKAFIGGLHLLPTPDRMRKFLSEMKSWKEINPGLEIFFELGEFQSRDVLKAAEKELFPIVDYLGLNENELGSLGIELEELAGMTTVLLHGPQEQRVVPHSRLNAAALEFARRCASFFAETGRRATESELVGYEHKYVESPVRTVGLGDTFSCAYFLAL